MKSLSPENQADIIEAFNSTSRYLDDLLNIDNIYFEQIVNRIYPAELQLNKLILLILKPRLWIWIYPFLMAVSTKIYNERDDFDIINFPFLDGGVPRRTSYRGSYTSLRRVS